MSLMRLVQGALLVSMLVFTTSVFASGITELAKKGDQYTISRVLCVDGLKVFQTFALFENHRGGAGASTIQLYELKKGRVVPATCTNTKISEKK